MKMNWIRKCVSGIGSSALLGIIVASVIYASTIAATFILAIKYQMVVVAPYLCTGGALFAFLVARIIIESLHSRECYKCGKLHRKQNIREKSFYDVTLYYCKACHPDA